MTRSSGWLESQDRTRAHVNALRKPQASLRWVDMTTPYKNAQPAATGLGARISWIVICGDHATQGTRRYLKRVIVRAAMAGLLHPCRAEWFLRRLHLVEA